MAVEAGEVAIAVATTSTSQENGASSLDATPTPTKRQSNTSLPLEDRNPLDFAKCTRITVPAARANTTSTHPAHRQARVSLDASSESGEPEQADQHWLQLVVQPIVKDTVGQRDNSGKLLEVFAANGSTFSDIKHKLWDKFSSRVKRIAVKLDDTWTQEDPTEAAWSKAMAFK
ncbi:Hypothetical protein PHPALM_13009 [Phytophthora palmivora]|uniref:Uncharacterized protein n=1 Tax=Phytophthora palmivora TaxID=4796 RepID=A0A2P4XYA5_9STRA|nr:Hypothetical protein PHPALM_13009 [Phytophthora palmivora]